MLLAIGIGLILIGCLLSGIEEAVTKSVDYADRKERERIQYYLEHIDERPRKKTVKRRRVVKHKDGNTYGEEIITEEE